MLRMERLLRAFPPQCPHPTLLCWSGQALLTQPRPSCCCHWPEQVRAGLFPPSPAPSCTPVPLRNESLLCLTISWPSLEPLRKQLNWTNISCPECLVSLTRWCPGEARGGPLMGTPGWWACPLTHCGKVFALGWRLVVYCEFPSHIKEVGPDFKRRRGCLPWWVGTRRAEKDWSKWHSVSRFHWVFVGNP